MELLLFNVLYIRRVMWVHEVTFSLIFPTDLKHKWQLYAYSETAFTVMDGSVLPLNEKKIIIIIIMYENTKKNLRKIGKFDTNLRK